MAKGEEIVKYVTQKVVEYIDTPREHRQQQRQTRRATKEPWTTRWFGMIPLSLSMMLGRSKKKAPSNGDDPRA